MIELENGLWINVDDISSMKIHSGSDNYTLGLYIYMKSGAHHYISHSPARSVHDVTKRIIENHLTTHKKSDILSTDVRC